MDFDILDKELLRVASDASYTGGYPEGIAAMFRQTLQIVAAVPDESFLARFKCLRYRKPRGRGSRCRLALTEDCDLLGRLQNGKSDALLIVEQISCDWRKKK